MLWKIGSYIFLISPLARKILTSGQTPQKPGVWRLLLCTIMILSLEIVWSTRTKQAALFRQPTKYIHIYRELNIPWTASKNEINSARRNFLAKFHPDRNPTAEATRKFSRITLAGNMLKDPITRLNFDRFGDLYSTDQSNSNCVCTLHAKLTVKSIHTGLNTPVIFIALLSSIATNMAYNIISSLVLRVVLRTRLATDKKFWLSLVAVNLAVLLLRFSPGTSEINDDVYSTFIGNRRNLLSFLSDNGLVKLFPILNRVTPHEYVIALQEMPGVLSAVVSLVGRDWQMFFGTDVEEDLETVLHYAHEASRSTICAILKCGGSTELFQESRKGRKRARDVLSGNKLEMLLEY